MYVCIYIHGIKFQMLCIGMWKASESSPGQ